MKLKGCLKKDGYVFMAEDLADTKEEAELVEKIDRKVNMEICDEAPHNYLSMEQWKEYFLKHGLQVVESHEQKPNKVRHGFFVLQLTQE